MQGMIETTRAAEHDQATALAGEIPVLYLDRGDDAYYVAEAVVGSEWLAADRAQTWDAVADFLDGAKAQSLADTVRQNNPHRKGRSGHV